MWCNFNMVDSNFDFLPKGTDFIAAAALPETTFTVWSNVFDRGKLASGESILVHGGSSGIGTTAIQLAHARGARVFATAGSAEKCAACEALGAERAINYRDADFVAAVKEATGGRGVDVVLDIIGGDYLQRNISVLAMDGRLVQIGMLGGTKSSIDTLPVLQRRLMITGSTLRPRPVAEKAAIARAVFKNVWPLVESGQLRAIVHATYPLADAAAAHRVMESSAHIGKLVLLGTIVIEMRSFIMIVAAVMATLVTSACGGGPSSPSGSPAVDIPALVVTDVAVGTGTQATTGRTVTVNYTGWLYVAAGDHRGTRFDASSDHGGPFTFVLGGNVIAGWNQGVVGMRVGGKRTLLIPSGLGYGTAGSGASIPPNSALVFDIQLVAVQ